jgi:hypothetical protein
MSNNPLSEYDQRSVELANKAYNRILGFHHDRQFTLSKATPSAGFLYHYTTAEGLKGIIEKSELWATLAYFLNDSTEILYGCQVFKEALDEWISNNQHLDESLSLALGFARDLRKAIGEDYLKMGIAVPIYLVCFCEKDNLLSQWRGYGQSGGYSLGFKIPSDPFTGQGFKPEPCTYTSRWMKVDYCRNEQIKKCRTILDSVLPIFNDPDTSKAIVAIGDHPQAGYSVILRAVVDMVLEEIIGFKNESFAVEEEWRIVVRRREFIKQGTDDDGKTPIPIQFRCAKGMIIPYVRLVPDGSNKLPIYCIRTGPSLDVNAARLAIPLLLVTNGYKGVRVRESGIPLRD